MPEWFDLLLLGLLIAAFVCLIPPASKAITTDSPCPMKIESVATILTVVGGTLIAPDQESKILAFCIIGAILGGFVGISTSSDVNTLSRRARGLRWGTNVSAGIFIGPLLTDYALAHWVPDARPIYVALAAGGLCGFAAVGILCILGPYLLSWITSKVKTPGKLP